MEEKSGIRKAGSFLFRLIRVLAVLGLAGMLAVKFYEIRRPPEKTDVEKPPPSVGVIVVEPESRVMTVTAFGTVKPRTSVQLAAEVNGRIEYMNPAFIEGGCFCRGDLLVRIDQRSYTLDKQAGAVRIRQAEIDIKHLDQDIHNLNMDIELSAANLKLASKELDRIRALAQNQFASKNSMDKAEQTNLQAKIQLQTVKNRLSLTQTMMEQRKASLAMANVEYKRAALALEKTEISAPFDGYVLGKHAEAGEYMNPGQVIGIVYKKDELDVEVRIPVEKIKWVNSFFHNGKMPKADVWPANGGNKQPAVWNARVARVKAGMDEKTRTLPITIEILDSQPHQDNGIGLIPGTFVKCRIIGDSYKELFVLPRYLLKPNNTIFTVHDGHLQEKKVHILRKLAEEVYVEAGLKSGEQIVSSPLPGAVEGMALIVKTIGSLR